MVIEASQSATTPVGVGVRLVPAGVQVVRGVPVVRASLLLAPIAAPPIAGACGKPVDLRHWPRDIEAMLLGADHAVLSKGVTSNLTVAFSPVVAGGPVPKPALSGTVLPARRAMFHQQPGSPGFEAWREQRAKDVAAIDALWQKLVALDDGDWGVIANGLSKSRAADRLASLLRPAAGGDPVPDIRGVGRGQAALLLSLERARSLLIRAQSSASDQAPPDRSHECNLAASSSLGKPDVGKAKSTKERDNERKAQEQAAATSRTTAAMMLQQQIGTSLKAVMGATQASDRAKLYKDLMACLPQDGVPRVSRKPRPTTRRSFRRRSMRASTATRTPQARSTRINRLHFLSRRTSTRRNAEEGPRRGCVRCKASRASPASSTSLLTFSSP